MVSNMVYRSHKALKIRGIKPFKLLAVLVFVIALVAWQPETVGFLACLLYAFSGFFEWAIGWKKPTEDDEIFYPQDDGSMMEPGDLGDGLDASYSSYGTRHDESPASLRINNTLGTDPTKS